MYYDILAKELEKLYEIAEKARAQGYDPKDIVEIPLANNMGERVAHLISAIHEQLDVKKTAELILELEKQYGFLDWRVGLKLIDYALEGKLIPYDDILKRIDLGVRLALGYITMGVVSAPLEGLVELRIKKRKDGKPYLALYYAGPIRGAGGTAAAVSVLFADYARKKAGLYEYDPTKEEIERYKIEIDSYHNKVARLQYKPSDEEIEFLVKHIPVEINGDPTSDKEVPSYKNLERVETNRIRGGMCLVIAEGIAQKAKKIYGKITEWGKEFGLEHWEFLGEYLKLQKEIQAKLAAESGGEIEGKEIKRKITLFLDEIKKEEITVKYPTPAGKYLQEITAGRPIFSLPMAIGGFRLRYGRSFATGFATSGIHPATMFLTYGFLAIGTQMRGERPKKSTIVTPVTSLHPPIVKLKDGTVKKVHSVVEAIKIANDVEEILFLGDILTAFGDWLNEKANLVPSPYVEEWWIQEFDRAAMKKTDYKIEFDVMKPRKLFKIEGLENLSQYLGIPKDRLEEIIRKPFSRKPTIDEAITISEKLGIPLHPEYTPFWVHITKEELIKLIEELRKAKIQNNKIYFHESQKELKAILEKLFIEHFREGEYFYINESMTKSLLYQLDNLNLEKAKKEFDNAIDALDLVNRLSPIEIRDVAGVYVGFRAGRPEKAKMREMTGRPHGLFPVGEEGGKMRNVIEAYNKGYVKAEFALYYCNHCKRYTIYRKCEVCGNKTKEVYVCKEIINRLKTSLFKQYKDWKKVEEEIASHLWAEAVTHSKNNCREPKRYSLIKLNIKHYVDRAVQKLKLFNIPKLVKGVRGTSNKDHIVERLEKAFLRSVSDVYVNKDGTIRYDGTQIPLTHFRPKDLIGVTIEKLKELGYTHDIYGNPLEREDQILQLKPQDIILPYGILVKSRLNKNKIVRTDAAEAFKKVANFVDEELKRLYNLEPYYNIEKAEDLIGKIVFGIAPHTSAAVVGRIIGFTPIQGIIAHPIWHAGQRRNCDGDETAVMLGLDALINFSREYLPDKRGARTMDAPLVLTLKLELKAVDDEVHDMDIVYNYPLEFYYETLKGSPAKDVKKQCGILTLGDFLKEEDISKIPIGFTHPTKSIRLGNKVSLYKRLKTMQQKTEWQLKLAERIRAVDENIVAEIVIEKHFMPDIKGNLRGFSSQVFRCTKCDTTYDRVPLSGKCPKCGGNIVFTVHEGTIKKYLPTSLYLARKYKIKKFTKQSLFLLDRRIKQIFGGEKKSLADFINS